MRLEPLKFMKGKESYNEEDEDECMAAMQATIWKTAEFVRTNCVELKGMLMGWSSMQIAVRASFKGLTLKAFIPDLLKEYEGELDIENFKMQVMEDDED
mmetsp:Transcript_35446/g.65641  ORF Transcript_35446/g.65641 Transcript_35446/m.65641 type:complete len:99 (+) Transcript_35446:3-299(+)